MTLAVAFLMQAAASPVADNVQLACTLAMPAAAPIAVSIDLKTKKLGVAAVSADEGPLARASSASETTAWPASTANALAFTTATGNGQYRVELMFDGAPTGGKARVRVVTLDGGVPLVAQGFCTARDGRRLADKGLARLPFDATAPGPRPLKLRPIKKSLAAGTCRVVARDRSVHRVDFTFLSVVDNEATVAYRFDDPGFAGTAGGTGTGVLFHLASAAEQLYALTVGLGDQPSLYVHTTFERSGNWIDLSRGSAVLALGECGSSPAAELASNEGNRAR